MGLSGHRASLGVDAEGRGREWLPGRREEEGTGQPYILLFLGMLESQWLKLFIKAQLVTVTEVVVLKGKDQKQQQ